MVQYGYAGAEGADVAEVVDRAQAEIYDVTEDRGSEDEPRIVYTHDAEGAVIAVDARRNH